MKLKRKSRDTSMPYVPMADMAFNLLIFFLVLAKAQQDTQAWEKAKSPGTTEILSTKVVVTVDRENKVYLNGAEIGTRGLTDEINYLFGNGTTEKRTVLLKIHKDAPAAIFEPVLEAVSLAGADVFHVLDAER